jgi:hypothetical protein
MNTIDIKLTFEDTFSFCKVDKLCTKTINDFENIKKEIGKIVHKETSNGVTYLWKLISVEKI